MPSHHGSPRPRSIYTSIPNYKCLALQFPKVEEGPKFKNESRDTDLHGLLGVIVIVGQ